MGHFSKDLMDPCNESMNETFGKIFGNNFLTFDDKLYPKKEGIKKRKLVLTMSMIILTWKGLRVLVMRRFIQFLYKSISPPKSKCKSCGCPRKIKDLFLHLIRNKGNPRKENLTKSGVRKQCMNPSEIQEEIQQYTYAKLSYPPPQKDRSNKRYDTFDVVLEKGDLV